MNRTDVQGGACGGAGRAGVADAYVESAREGDAVGHWWGFCVQSDVAGVGGGRGEVMFPRFLCRSQMQQNRTFTHFAL